ncbi:MAG: hypothetical protein ACRDQW_18390 [Haloechinothrix sp.]
MREAREGWRSIVQRAMEGQPFLIIRDSQPAAVLLRFDEVRRWRRIEEGLAALHGLEIYPELARNSTEIAALVRGTARPSETAVRGLARQPRDILGALRTTAVSEAPRAFARLLDEIVAGRLMTILVKGKPEVTLVSPREYDRLADLVRTVHWFETAGLDLARAEPPDVGAWVRTFRERPDAAEATGA